MHGILTETASSGYATPRTYDSKTLPVRFANGIPTKEASIFYQRPWLGGTWTLRDAIEYMLTADFAILDLAASRSPEFLRKAYEMGRAGRRATGGPYAYIVPTEQWDRSSAVEMVRRLALAGVEVKRATAGFQANGKQYAAGTLVMPAAQPFRGYLVDLMEPQQYPEIKTGTTGPTKRPYDIAGWTLRMNMGVTVDRADQPFDAKLEPAGEIALPAPALNHRDNSSFVATADLLAQNAKVRWASDGAILVESSPGFAKGAWELKRPRLALYESWTANIDAGWTEWLLDNFKVPYGVIHNADFKNGGLAGKYDTVILPAQSPTSILNGMRASTRPDSGSASQQRPDYVGGIGGDGLAKLLEFVEKGGTLIAIDSAADLPAQKFPLAVNGLLKSTGGGMEGPPETSVAEDGYYCPGSLIRIDVDNTHPIAFGMPKEAFAFSSGGQAWDVTLMPELNKGDREIRSVAKYAKDKLLASGWISGEKAVLGKQIVLDVRFGKGRVVLFGFRPQFRGQTFGTFKLLLNAIYYASAVKL
jgi:hypothetical protein